MTPARNYPPAPQKAPRATEVAGQEGRIRHGNDHVSIALLPGGTPRRTHQCPRRNPRLLAPVPRPGIRLLSAGTALHARPRPGLARQADRIVAAAFELTKAGV